MIIFVRGSDFSSQGVMCRTLQGHGHWVNTMALSTDYSLQTGAFDPSDRTLDHLGVREMPCEQSCDSVECHVILITYSRGVETEGFDSIQLLEGV